MPKPMNFILAGTHAQAAWYAHENGWKKDQWRYVFSIDDLHGVRHAKLHKVGTFWQRNDYREIEDYFSIVCCVEQAG